MRQKGKFFVFPLLSSNIVLKNAEVSTKVGLTVNNLAIFLLLLWEY